MPTELSYLREVKIEPGTAQPTCRRDHSAVVHNDFMYMYGGFIGSRGANQELWAFNIGAFFCGCLLLVGV